MGGGGRQDRRTRVPETPLAQDNVRLLQPTIALHDFIQATIPLIKRSKQ